MSGEPGRFLSLVFGEAWLGKSAGTGRKRAVPVIVSQAEDRNRFVGAYDLRSGLADESHQHTGRVSARGMEQRRLVLGLTLVLAD